MFVNINETMKSHADLHNLYNYK